MNSKRHILRSTEKPTSVFIGIAASINEFQFLKLLQAELELMFQINEQITIELNNDKEITYSIYSYYDSERLVMYDLIANTSENGTLVDFLDNINYVIRCSAEFIEIHESNIQSQISNLDSVLFAHKIDLINLTKKQIAILQNVFPYI